MKREDEKEMISLVFGWGERGKEEKKKGDKIEENFIRKFVIFF